MASFRERLQEWMDYMGGIKQTALAEILSDDDGHPFNKKTISGWLSERESTPTLGPLLFVAGRIGTDLNWLTGNPVAPMWAPEIREAVLWLRGQLHRVAGQGDIMCPIHVRMLSLMKVMAEQAPQLRQRRFAAGILGLSPERFEEFESGMLTVNKPMIGRLAAFTGLPETWIQTGDDAALTPLDNLGEYTSVVAHWKAKGISPAELQEVTDLVAETALAKRR